MLYSHGKTFHIKEYVGKILFEEFVYKYLYNIIVWVFTAIQAYICWILLLKAQIIFVDRETLG